MINLNVNLQERSYPIFITDNYSEISECIGIKYKDSKIIIITDKNLDYYQSEELVSSLKSKGYNIYKYILEAGEKSKTLETVENIYRYLFDSKVDRNDVIVAFGGGVVGDIAGFVASTYLRGIAFIQIPTSLLAQVDSSVGGKVGVNFNNAKNVIGAFYQPKLVYINLNTLRTLPLRELRSGLAEVIVHTIIADGYLFDYIDNNFEGIFSYNNDILEHIISKNCAIKSAVVEKDEKENGIRAILNFGHTIGHAIESVYKFNLLHGECVSIGIVGAFRLAQHMGMVEIRTLYKVINILKKLGLPYYMDKLEVEKVLHQMSFDKKITNNTLTFILPEQIGKVAIYKVEDKELIKRVLAELGTAPVMFGY